MKHSTVIWLIVASALVLLGLVLFTLTMTAAQWDFTRLDGTAYATVTTPVTEPFTSVSVQLDTADVVFCPTEDGTCRVVSVESEECPHTVTVENGVLTVTATDNRRWYDNILFFGLGSPSVTVYLPRGDYEALTVEGTTGDVDIPADFTFASARVEVTTGDVVMAASVAGSLTVDVTTGQLRLGALSAGDVTLETGTGTVTLSEVSCTGKLSVTNTTGAARLVDVTAASLTVKGTTGDALLERVTVAGSALVDRTTGDVILEESTFGSLTVRTNTGDVSLERSDAESLFLNTTTGWVKGSLRTEKVFQVSTTTGNVDVPRSVTGGPCEVSTTTGDVHLWVQP